MNRWFRTSSSPTRSLLRTRPGPRTVAACVPAMLVLVALGVAGGVIAVGASRDAGEGLIPWAAITGGLVLVVLSAGAMLTLLTAVVPQELAVDESTGDVVLHRHPLRDIRIRRRRLRHVRVSGRSTMSGTPRVVVRLATRGRRIPLIVDGGHDLDAALGRVLGHAEGVARTLDIPLVREGWARDPGRDPRRQAMPGSLPAAYD